MIGIASEKAIALFRQNNSNRTKRTDLQKTKQKRKKGIRKRKKIKQTSNTRALREKKVIQNC